MRIKISVSKWMLAMAAGACGAAPAMAQMVDLGTLSGGVSCAATGVNDAHTVIGVCRSSHASGGHVVAVRQLSGEAAPTALPTLAPGKPCTAVSLGQGGAISGDCENANGMAAPVRWAPGSLSAPQLLQPLPGLLGLLADVEASAGAINAQGNVIGVSISSNGHRRAVIWTPGATIAKWLPDPPMGLLGTVLGCAPVTISDGAAPGPIVAGQCEINNAGITQDIAVRWTPSGTSYAVSPLAGLGGGHCSVSDINLSGAVVGSCENATGDSEAVLWEAGDTVAQAFLVRDQSTAIAINNSGVIAGNYVTDDGYTHAYVGLPEALFDIGTLSGAHQCHAVGIDDSGSVAAVCGTDTGVSHASAYSTSNGLVDLGTLGGFNSRPTAISRNGAIVGASQVGDGHMHAFFDNTWMMAVQGTQAKSLDKGASRAIQDRVMGGGGGLGTGPEVSLEIGEIPDVGQSGDSVGLSIRASDGSSRGVSGGSSRGASGGSSIRCRAPRSLARYYC